MSVQNFTKSLRDKKIALEDRINSASNVLDGSTPLYLPQKPVVILDWVFSALSTEPNARRSSHLWDFLCTAWLECDKDSRSKIVRSYKLPQILLDTWKNETVPIDSIETSLELLLESTLLGCNSDPQAGQIIAGYCNQLKNRDTERNLLPLFQRQMISRSKIFKNMPEVLDTITLVPNNGPFLVDYFSLRDVTVTPADPKALGEVMRAIVLSKTLVTERFTELCTNHPQHVPEILRGLGETKLGNERETLGLLLEKQISQQNWDAITLLIDRVPVEVVAQMNRLVSGLDANYHEQLAVGLLIKASQTRKLGTFIVEWTRCKNSHWFSAQVLRNVGECLEQLSSAQLLDLLKSLDGNVLYIISNLTYKFAASPAFREEILKLLNLKDPHISFSILSLWPSLPQDHPEIVSQIAALGSPECALLLLERGIDIKYPHTRPSNVGQLVARFYKTIPDLSVLDMLSEGETVELLMINDLWEYPLVSERLVSHFIQQKFNFHDFNAPLQVLPKKLKEDIMILAWSQLNLRLILELLESSPPRSTECETEPALLVKLAKKVQEDDADLLMKITAKLCAQQTYASGLAKLVNSKDWPMQCLATVVSGGKDQKLVKTLELNLKSGRNVTASLACLGRLNEVVDPAILGQVIHDHKDNANVFKLLCRSTDDWQSITAYFIYTKCIYVDTFLEFMRRMDPSLVVVLLRECLRDKHYKAVETLFSQKDLSKEEIIPFITLMVQTNFTNPQDMDEQQVNEYFELASHLVRENSWVLSQYALETLIMTVSKVCTRQFTTALDQPAELYTRMCFFIGQTLLFQRHRLNSRNHLVIAALSGLLRCISGSKLNAEQRLKVGNMPRFMIDHPELCRSTACAEALLRVVGNFCDPPQRSVRENAGRNNLNSSVGRIRRQVAKVAGVLVGNYVTLSLQNGFSSEISPIMQQSIFTLLVVLSAQELKSTIASMDNAGRAYMKTVHDSFLALGKWKKD